MNIEQFIYKYTNKTDWKDIEKLKFSVNEVMDIAEKFSNQVQAGVMPTEGLAGGLKRLEQDLISIKKNMERWLSIKDEYRAKEEVYILETKQTCEILLEELASQREA